MADLLPVLVLLLGVALALQSDFHVYLDRAIQSGDRSGVAQILQTSSELPNLKNFETAYANGHVGIIEYLLAYMRPSMANPTTSNIIRLFFLRIARRSPMSIDDPQVRNRVIDKLIPYTVYFEVSSIVSSLSREGDTGTIEKLRKAAEADPRIKFHTLSDAVTLGDDKLINRILHRASPSEQGIALRTALTLGSLEVFDRILETVAAYHIRYNFLHAILDRRSLPGVPIGDLEYAVREIADTFSTTELQSLYEQVEVSADPRLLTILNEKLGRTVGLPHHPGRVGLQHNKNSRIISTKVGETTSVTIDGDRNWGSVHASLEDPAIAHSDSITITNTGYDLPKILPTGMDVSVTATHLTLTNIPGFARVPWGFFIRVQSITKLTLANLGINALSMGALAGLPNLECLDLSHNDMETFPNVLKFSIASSLTSIDVTGNPIVRGCIPPAVEKAVVPPNLLPSCEYRLEKPTTLGEFAYDPLALLPRLESSFKCKEDMDFLQLHARHVYKVGILQGTHYGLVFMFDDGIMLSELVVGQVSNKIAIYSTCARTPRDISHEDQLATLMFTMKSPLWRKHRPEYSTTLEYITSHRCYSYGDQEIPDSRVLTGSTLMNKFKEYENDHVEFVKGIDSCVTFAHVFYRDLFK